MDSINFQLLQLLTAGNSFADAGLIIAVGYLIKTVRERLGLPNAIDVVKGRVAELTASDKYALLSQVARALVHDDVDADGASIELAGHISDFLETRQFFNKGDA